MNRSKIRDDLFNGDLKGVCQCSMAVVDSLQSYSKGEQLGALGYCFLSYAKITGQKVEDVFTAVSNMASEADKKRAEFKAVDEYILSQFKHCLR